MSEVSPVTDPTQSFAPDALPTLFERYQILGILGEGGMGTVFKGYHVNLKRFVAIKTLRLDSLHRPELVNRFLREMEVVGQMDHPNVVRASDAGEKNGVFHLVMEYLTGSDLGHLVAQKGRLEVADACELTRQAALGLAHIHQTLVHRDIKPSNLMLTTSGVVKILDLGLARLHEADDRERTPEGCVMGTYDYMAPEQAIGSAEIDGRADIYSLGCTLFKLLTGRAPFSGPSYDSAAKKLFAHCHTPLTTLEEFGSIPEGLREVLLRMTAKEPGERYPSAREVARALTPFAAGSQPLQLLGQSGAAIESALQPLPQPLPVELSRLTDSARDTVLKTPSAPGLLGRALPPRWRRPALGVGLLACALAASAWFAGPIFFNRRTAEDTGEPQPSQPSGTAGAVVPGNLSGPGPRSLDELAAHTYHRLLDQRPVPVGGEGEDPRKWRWDKGQQLLEVTWHDTLLFPLGTTSRSRYGFEVGIDQPRWTGNVGIFWGYQEDANVKNTRRPNQEFARFQFIRISQRPGKMGEDLYSVCRGKGSLWYDMHGEIQIKSYLGTKQDVPFLVGGEKILVIGVERNRLSRALLGSIELTTLCSDGANKTYEVEPYQGGLGLITQGHQATFSDVRFIAHSSN